MSLDVNLLSMSSFLERRLTKWHQMPLSSLASNAVFFSVQRRRVIFILPPTTCGSGRSIKCGFTWQNQKGLPPLTIQRAESNKWSCTLTPCQQKETQGNQDKTQRFKAVCYSCPLSDDCTISSALQSLISATSIAQTFRYQISGRIALHSRVEWAVVSTMFYLQGIQRGEQQVLPSCPLSQDSYSSALLSAEQQYRH